MARTELPKEVLEVANLLESQAPALESLAQAASPLLEAAGVELISDTPEQCVEGLEEILACEEFSPEQAAELRAIISKMKGILNAP